MQLHFTIIKHRHGTCADAQQLESHIRDADLVSFEDSYASEKRAQYHEEFHKTYLSSSQLRRKIFLGLSSVIRLPNYSVCLEALLLRYETPVVLLERFPAEIAQHGKERYAAVSSSSEPFFSFLAGRYALAMSGVWDLAKEMKAMKEERDANIASNAHTIRDRIVDLYPHFRWKDSVNYVIFIGALHAPEQGLSAVDDATVTVVNIPCTLPYTHWLETIFQKAIASVPYDACHDDIARYLLGGGLRVVLHENKFSTPLSHLLVHDMGADNLEELMDRMQQLHENDDAAEKVQLISTFFAEQGTVLPQTKRACRKLYQTLRK